MKEEFADIQYTQIKEYNYTQWFNEKQYNGKYFRNQNVKNLFLL